MSALNQLLVALKVQANVFHNGQYCGAWAIDTSGTNLMTFHVVSRGKCVIQVDDEAFDLNTGDAIFMPADARHRLSLNLAQDQDIAVNQATSLSMTDPVNGESTGLVCGHFTHQHPIFDRLLKQLPTIIIVRHSDETASSQIIELILNESKESGQSSNFLLDKLSDALFYVLVRDNLDTCSGVLAAMTHPKLNKPLTLIHNTTDKPLSVDVLASSAGMSRSAFSALFKEIVEQSPAEYITQWRMTQAYRWLVDDGISTYDASLRCGYESEASFSKAFKRTMGVGPGEARQRSKV